MLARNSTCPLLMFIQIIARLYIELTQSSGKLSNHCYFYVLLFFVSISYLNYCYLFVSISIFWWTTQFALLYLVLFSLLQIWVKTVSLSFNWTTLNDHASSSWLCFDFVQYCSLLAVSQFGWPCFGYEYCSPYLEENRSRNSSVTC